jgi:hypothetical protein
MAIELSNMLGFSWTSLPAQIVPTGCDVCGASNGQIWYAIATEAGADMVTCPLRLFILDADGRHVHAERDAARDRQLLVDDRSCVSKMT